MTEYGLPATTYEDLEVRWSKTVRFGDRALLAGRCFTGMEKPEYYGAVYGFVTEDKSPEGTVRLLKASEVEFTDEGHALAWAIRQAGTEEQDEQ